MGHAYHAEEGRVSETGERDGKMIYRKQGLSQEMNVALDALDAARAEFRDCTANRELGEAAEALVDAVNYHAPSAIIEQMITEREMETLDWEGPIYVSTGRCSP
jgi:hypothetical protein